MPPDFSSAAIAYESGRPGWPAEAVRTLLAELGIGFGSRALDLAAGTGKLTRLLAPLMGEVVAVEPSQAMRDVLTRRLPDIDVQGGRAEDIPLDDGSVDAVFVAEAFHWFDAELAVAEISRVLRPGGGLALMWNVPLRSGSAWLAEVEDILAPLRDSGTSAAQRYASGHWRRVFGATGPFSPLHEARFRHEQRLDHPGVVDQIASRSYVQNLPADARGRALGSVRELLAAHPETRETGVLTIPYRTDVFWARRLPAVV